MSFLSLFKKENTSKDVAKDRLKVVLIHDRCNIKNIAPVPRGVEIADMVSVRLKFMSYSCSIISGELTPNNSKASLMIFLAAKANDRRAFDNAALLASTNTFEL